MKFTKLLSPHPFYFDRPQRKRPEVKYDTVLKKKPSVSDDEEDEESWLPSRMKTASSVPTLPVKKMTPQKSIPGAGFLRFEKPLRAVDPADWPKEYIREERVLRGINLPSRNKFTADQLQTAFRYLGGYRRQTSVPPELIRRLRVAFPDFEDAFRTVSNKTLTDKIRAWPKDEHLLLS